ncbi:hypothetical protein CIHG_03104 [Coccidioides immitis H538.4]|uniref:Uncharacterized protein n=3 Tax=Coccidioides immitis TaxID=5501 RepID=A0A0J8R1M2_COCIT|nr:hypothetical protein CIRG_00799 [Coccidioides immitis RMSCC 2394]KMU78225.1 hypothetical protein CISG_07065 [Coccidioides immitis RMSCC 3703]KMU85320.1 hypothetical protein CIHG_03104 [Coccidioides immitis H538.4]
MESNLLLLHTTPRYSQQAACKGEPLLTAESGTSTSSGSTLFDRQTRLDMPSEESPPAHVTACWSSRRLGRVSPGFGPDGNKQPETRATSMKPIQNKQTSKQQPSSLGDKEQCTAVLCNFI